MTDLLILLSALSAWSLWTPGTLRARSSSRTQRAVTLDASETEWLTRLRSQLVASSNFSEALRSLPPPSQKLTPDVESLRKWSEHFGISVIALVNQLLLVARQESQQQARWRERTTAAQVSSILLATIPILLFGLTVFSDVRGGLRLLLSPFGMAALALFLTLTMAARLWLKKLAQSALRTNNLQPATKSEAKRSMTPQAARVAAALSVLFIWPTGMGVVLGAIAYALAGDVWMSLSSSTTVERSMRANRERPWLTCLLASALSAGLDWQRAVDLLVAEAKTDQVELRAVATRLGWGIDPSSAFAKADVRWQEVAFALRQSLQSGAPVAAGLFALSEHWQRELGELEIDRIERIAARSVIPVSLLQLPAFMVGGLLPMVATSVEPLVSNLLSTSA